MSGRKSGIITFNYYNCEEMGGNNGLLGGLLLLLVMVGGSHETTLESADLDLETDDGRRRCPEAFDVSKIAVER